MQLHRPTLLNRLAKGLARPLSRLVAGRVIADGARAAEAYWCILLGKGAGTGWALDAEIRAAANCIRTPRPVLLDVGANTGQWSAEMLRLFPAATLYLVEPQPACQQRILARGLPGAVLIPRAVSDQAGTRLPLHTNGDESGIASLHPRQDSCFQQLQFSTIEVETTTIDDIVREQRLAAVDFLKMDIEGHELHALRGAARSLAERKIKALAFEFGSSNINSRTYFRDFWDLLTPLGYELLRIVPSGRLLPIRQYYEDCEYFRGVTNYLARLTG
ncbi:MAG: FkbM family methyltransferase [Pirellulaceae bacterium]|nr:FkbM family methyltransferase [Pirellulaceae bacterium]